MKRVFNNLLKIGVPLFITFFFTANLYQAHAYYGFSYGGYGLPYNVFNGYPYGYPYGGYGLPYNVFNGYPYGFGFGWNPAGYSNPFLPAVFPGYSPWLDFQEDFSAQLLRSFDIPLQGIPWDPSIPVEDLYANDLIPEDAKNNPYYTPPSPSDFKWFPGIGWTNMDGAFYNPITGTFSAWIS
jgi:hypothetical protein